jgi:hypothetical protein
VVDQQPLGLYRRSRCGSAYPAVAVMCRSAWKSAVRLTPGSELTITAPGRAYGSVACERN